MGKPVRKLQTARRSKPLTAEELEEDRTAKTAPVNPSPKLAPIEKEPIVEKIVEKPDSISEIELNSPPRSSQFDLVRRIGNEYKNRANDLFKANHFLSARDAYNEAIRAYASALTFGSSTRVDPVLYLNRGFVSLKLLQFVDADEDFTTALRELETDSGHYNAAEANTYSLKCFWRRADARKQLKLYPQAIADLNKMLDMTEAPSIVSHKDIKVKIGIINSWIELKEPLSPVQVVKEAKQAVAPQVGKISPTVVPQQAAAPAVKAEGAKTSVPVVNTPVTVAKAQASVAKAQAPVSNTQTPATKTTAPITKTQTVKPSTPVEMNSNGTFDPKKKRDEASTRVMTGADVKAFMQKSEEDVHALITRDVHHLITKAQLRNLGLPGETEDHSDCGKDPTPEILNYFRLALNYDMNTSDGVLAFIKCVNTMIPFFEGNCSRGAELFVKIRGFESLARDFIFIPRTASTILDLFGAVGMCFDSEFCKDQIFPSVISVSLQNYDIERLQLLVSFLNMTIVDKPDQAQEFYDVVSAGTGSKLLTIVNDQVIKNKSEYNLMQDFLHLIGKFFAFSPSWLQRKFGFNLKQTITLVSFALIADHFDELFFIDLMIMIRDICRYIEMRNGSGLMPIKSKKLFDDIHEISSTLAVKLNPMLVGNMLMEDQSYIHVFDSLTVSVSILPFPFKDVHLYIPHWIDFLHQSDDDDDLIDSILCLLHATAKKNTQALEPFIPRIQLIYLMKITLTASAESASPLSSKLGNHALIGFLHIWFRSASMDQVYTSFMAESGHITLCKYLSTMEHEAQSDNYSDKFLKTLALATHCLIMLMAQHCRLKLYQQDILPSLNRLSKAYTGESHRLFMTAILNLCKNEVAMREYEKMDGAAPKKFKEALKKNVQS